MLNERYAAQSHWILLTAPDQAVPNALVIDDWDAWKTALDNVDAETAEFIIQLRLEDLSTPAPEPVAKVTCSACSHEHPPHDVVKAPCEHDYCAACLENL
ncbi:hypothetical protein B0A55_01075, partial [Friedmanniomyces simplex]